MRERLIQYVHLLFAGAPGSEEIRQEILQNTLDRYDDLVSQGKSPEAAYRLAISGIGDINEILGSEPSRSHTAEVYSQPETETDFTENRRSRAVAIALYILSPIPLFLLSEFGLDTMGLCFTLLLVAAATYVLMLSKRGTHATVHEAAYGNPPEYSPRRSQKEAVGKVLGPICLFVYLLVSFLTHAWYITWLIFPIFGCIRGLINAILDLKEANQYEN